MPPVIKTLAKLMALASLSLWLSPAAAQDPFNDSIPDQYTVKQGDTLWDISALFLKKPWLWPEIWHVNPQIENPHLIYPGDQISLVYIDGKPQLMLSRGRNVKLSPQVREISHRSAIPSLPLDIINNFLSRNRVVEAGALETAPYVLAGREKHLLTGKGQRFYARGDFSEPQNNYGVYRHGGSYVDPINGRTLGIRAQDVGTAQLQNIDGNIATLRATRSVEEIRINDRLLPLEKREIDSVFYPSAAPANSEGRIVSVEGAVSTGGMLDVVAINLGANHGMAIGNILTILKSGEVVRDRVRGDNVEIPPDRSGLLMVFRTFDNMSYGLILGAERPISVADIVRSPEN